MQTAEEKKCSQYFTQEVSFRINCCNNQQKTEDVSLEHQERCMMTEHRLPISNKKAQGKRS